MSMTVRDVTTNWREISARVTDGGPYHSYEWGAAVADSFDGTFRVFELGNSENVSYLPIVVGGELAPGAFCSGPIGYGGLLREGSVPLSLSEHISALRAIEHELNLTCIRLSLGPEQTKALVDDSRMVAGQRTTTLVPLHLSPDEAVASYARVVRKSIRKAQREGVEVTTLGTEHSEAALRLIHETQGRIGSTFRTPRSLIEWALRSDSHDGPAFGAELDGHLIAVGLFRRSNRRAVFLFMGWDSRFAPLAANYLVLDAAIRLCGQLGDLTLDLGYSHSADILRYKLHWGGILNPTCVLDTADCAVDF